MLENYKKEIASVKVNVKGILDDILVANKIFLQATLNDCNIEGFNEAKSHLKNIGSKIQDIDNEIVRILALYSPEAKDLREVVSFFKINNELLRASSNTRNLIRGFLNNCQIVDKRIIQEFVGPLQSSAIRALEYTYEMFDIDDVDELKDLFHAIIVEEDKTDELYMMLEKNIFDSMDDNSDFQKIHNILRAFRRSEKIADRTISVATLLLYIYEGGVLKRA